MVKLLFLALILASSNYAGAEILKLSWRCHLTLADLDRTSNSKLDSYNLATQFDQQFPDVLQPVLEQTAAENPGAAVTDIWNLTAQEILASNKDVVAGITVDKKQLKLIRKLIMKAQRDPRLMAQMTLAIEMMMPQVYNSIRADKLLDEVSGRYKSTLRSRILTAGMAYWINPSPDAGDVVVNGTNYGERCRTLTFPFALTELFDDKSILEPAIRIKLAQNLTDYDTGLISLETKYLGNVRPSEWWMEHEIREYETVPQLAPYLDSEIRSYSTMYRFAKLKYTKEQLARLIKNPGKKKNRGPTLKKLAEGLAFLDESEFVAQFVGESVKRQFRTETQKQQITKRWSELVVPAENSTNKLNGTNTQLSLPNANQILEAEAKLTIDHLALALKSDGALNQPAAMRDGPESKLVYWGDDAKGAQVFKMVQAADLLANKISAESNSTVESAALEAFSVGLNNLERQYGKLGFLYDEQINRELANPLRLIQESLNVKIRDLENLDQETQQMQIDMRQTYEKTFSKSATSKDGGGELHDENLVSYLNTVKAMSESINRAAAIIQSLKQSARVLDEAVLGLLRQIQTPGNTFLPNHLNTEQGLNEAEARGFIQQLKKLQLSITPKKI